MSRSNRTRRSRSRRGRPRNKALLAAAVLAVLVALGGLSGVGYVLSIAASAPPLGELKAADKGEISTVYASGGERLGVIQAEELRQPVPGSRIPKLLKQATVAIEDERFYRHSGIDYEGIARAAVENAKAASTREGGSTITQQVVRNLYISNERTYTRKIKEAKLAEELEQEHSKSWILNKYLDTVPYGTAGGQSAIGVGAAAKVYFDKRVEDLDLDEAALLAGLPQAPTDYSPFRSPKAAQNRRDEVLGKMVELKMITPGQATDAMARTVDTDSIKGSKYFTERREKYFFDYVKDELLKEYGAKTVRQGGLQVTTTIDLAKQKAARAAMRGRLAGVGPSSAIVSIDPKNGYIKAMASTAEYGRSKFNIAAKGTRQPGSVFKIMTLMTALRRGVSPTSTTYTSRSPTIVKDPLCPGYEVNTYSRAGGGTMNLVKATTKSDNSVFIQLALDLGPEAVKQTARDLGIKSKLMGYCAETLGGLTDGVTPLETANAFATIASGGYRNRPTAITKITFPSGRVAQGKKLPPRFRIKRTKAFDSTATYEAVKILKENIKGGTGQKAKIGCPAGGKTGTTDLNKDAWFVGFTPRLATATWVGFPNPPRSMNGLYFGANLDGGTFPAEIWGDYMKKAKGSYCGDFTPPGRPFQARPFFGKYSRTGASGDDSGQARGAFGGGGTGSRGFDPRFYDSAPQAAPASPADPPAPQRDSGGGKEKADGGGKAGGGEEKAGDDGDSTDSTPSTGGAGDGE